MSQEMMECVRCWDGVDFTNPLELSQVEMSTLEGLCLCPFPAGEQRMELELPDFSSKLPNPTKIGIVVLLKQINLGFRGRCRVKLGFWWDLTSVSLFLPFPKPWRDLLEHSMDFAKSLNQNNPGFWGRCRVKMDFW